MPIQAWFAALGFQPGVPMDPCSKANRPPARRVESSGFQPGVPREPQRRACCCFFFATAPRTFMMPSNTFMYALVAVLASFGW